MIALIVVDPPGRLVFPTRFGSTLALVARASEIGSGACFTAVRLIRAQARERKGQPASQPVGDAQGREIAECPEANTATARTLIHYVNYTPEHRPLVGPLQSPPGPLSPSILYTSKHQPTTPHDHIKIPPLASPTRSSVTATPFLDRGVDGRPARHGHTAYGSAAL